MPGEVRACVNIAGHEITIHFSPTYTPPGDGSPCASCGAPPSEKVMLYGYHGFAAEENGVPLLPEDSNLRTAQRRLDGLGFFGEVWCNRCYGEFLKNLNMLLENM
jgi:hypothetical protein